MIEPAAGTFLFAQHLADLSAQLAGVGDHETGFRRRMDAATNSITEVQALIRTACRRRV
jgi:hypothetical protein